MPAAAERIQKAEALDTRRAWCSLRQNRQMETQAKAKEISLKPFTDSYARTRLMILEYPVTFVSLNIKG